MTQYNFLSGWARRLLLIWKSNMQRRRRELSGHNQGGKILQTKLKRVLAGRREERGNAELGVKRQLHDADIQVNVSSELSPSYNTQNPGVR